MVWAFHRAYGRSNDRMAPLFASRTARTATSCSDFKRTIHHVARSLFINPLTLRLLTSSSTARAGAGSGEVPGADLFTRGFASPGRVQGKGSGVGRRLARSLAGAAAPRSGHHAASDGKGIPVARPRGSSPSVLADAGLASLVPVPGRQHAVEVGQPTLMAAVLRCSADRAVPESEQPPIMDDSAVGSIENTLGGGFRGAREHRGITVQPDHGEDSRWAEPFDEKGGERLRIGLRQVRRRGAAVNHQHLNLPPARVQANSAAQQIRGKRPREVRKRVTREIIPALGKCEGEPRVLLTPAPDSGGVW